MEYENEKRHGLTSQHSLAHATNINKAPVKTTSGLFLRNDNSAGEISSLAKASFDRGPGRTHVSGATSSSTRQSLRALNFDLNPVQGQRNSDSARRTSLSKRLKSLPRFSQNPQHRKSTQPQKTASVLALQEQGKAFFEPLQLIKTIGPEERNQVYMVGGKNVKMADPPSSQRRQEASVHTVTVPKRGLIKLTGLAYEFDNPGYYDSRKEPPAPRKYWDHMKFRYVIGSDKPGYDACCALYNQ